MKHGRPAVPDLLAHAEMNAIRAFELSGRKFVESNLYTTLEPCPMCLGAIRLARFKTVHYASQNVLAGSTILIEATDFMRQEAPQFKGPANDLLELLLLGLLTETVFRLELPRGLKHLAVRQEKSPQAVQLGKSWHQSCVVDNLIADRANVQEMLAVLSAQLS